ncbi:MAG TPA: sulfatase [Tepidisphaeraceae bacterium]|nr:sulfatase [Tepidisphaeraceae bacterium]
MERFTSLVLLALLLFTSGGRAAGVPARRPNIVFFIADDMSIKDSAAYGPTNIPGPNMAALASEGMTFDRAYATSPSCAPSRAALLTGCYNVRNGVMWNHQRADAAIKKWPAYFQALGYEVVAIGKVSHYAHVLSYGFDYAAFYNYHQDVCVEEAVKWLANRGSGKPLCLLVGTNFPHVPWPKQGILTPSTVELPAKVADTPETRVARTRYDAGVRRADSDLGLVRDAVAKHLPADNTIFLFSADQGAQWPFAKWNLYDAGLHVPLIVVWPGHVKPASRTAAMVSWLDILPTLLDAAGVDPKTAAPDIDGKSFLPVLRNAATEHRDRIFATHSGDGNINIYPTRSVLMGNLKYIRNLDPTLEYHTHIDLRPQDTNYWPSWVEHAKTDPKIAALIHLYHHRPAEELYDLSTDPDELHNLTTDRTRASDLAKMRAALDEWMKANHDLGAATDYAMKPGGETKGRGGQR